LNRQLKSPRNQPTTPQNSRTMTTTRSSSPHLPTQLHPPPGLLHSVYYMFQRPQSAITLPTTSTCMWNSNIFILMIYLVPLFSLVHFPPPLHTPFRYPPPLLPIHLSSVSFFRGRMSTWAPSRPTSRKCSQSFSSGYGSGLRKGLD
jgi:hypothetical protein